MHKRLLLLSLSCAAGLNAQTDPGLRRGPSSTGRPLDGLNAAELAFLEKGKAAFDEIDDVAKGLGPRFNRWILGVPFSTETGRHEPTNQPSARRCDEAGSAESNPSFLQADGPARVARRRRNPDGSPDGGVHNLFVITGRADAPAGCRVQQPDFANLSNFSLRIPTPHSDWIWSNRFVTPRCVPKLAYYLYYYADNFSH